MSKYRYLYIYTISTKQTHYLFLPVVGFRELGILQGIKSSFYLLDIFFGNVVSPAK